MARRKRNVRMAVIGLGNGQEHARGYHSHGQADLVALCDQDPGRLSQVAADLGVERTYTDTEEMFEAEALDGVSIALPNHLHAPVTIAALRRGLHVLCEKPMAMTVKEAERMNAAARRARRNLMINFSYRFTAASYALKRQVDAGAVGEIYFGRSVWHRRRGIPGLGGWFTDRERSGGGPLIDLGVHRLDLALWLMGYPEPVAVTGSTYSVLAPEIARKAGESYTVEDLACGLVKCANDATLILEASWALNQREREHMETRLYGDRGGLVHRAGDEYAHEAEIYTDEGGDMFTKRLDYRTDPTPSSYHEFVDSIIERRKPMATGEQGLKVMKILEGIYRSAETGREVRYRRR